MRLKNLPHPIPYQGSKRNLAPDILRYFPESIDVLYEPFAGSAAISIAAAEAGLAKSFYINDLNKPLIDLWHEIINRPDQLAEKYEILWNEQLADSKKFYIKVRDDFNRSGTCCFRGLPIARSHGLVNTVQTGLI